jgi:hypothetical protein
VIALERFIETLNASKSLPMSKHMSPSDFDEINRYMANGYLRVEGFTFPGVAHMLGLVHTVQCSLPAAQSRQHGVAEIGVHHGRFFLMLQTLCDKDAPCLAVDVFDDQHLNIDNSGQGNRERFEANLKLFRNPVAGETTILAADSTAQDFSVYRGKYKHVSIDGGHTVEHTVCDLKTAEALVSPNGVVWLDDVMHPHWPGVFEGVLRYLDTKPTLVPFAMGHNKLLLAKLSVSDHFLRAFVQTASQGHPWVSSVPWPGPHRVLKLFGHTVCAAAPISLDPRTLP